MKADENVELSSKWVSGYYSLSMFHIFHSAVHLHHSLAKEKSNLVTEPRMTKTLSVVEWLPMMAICVFFGTENVVGNLDSDLGASRASGGARVDPR